MIGKEKVNNKSYSKDNGNLVRNKNEKYEEGNDGSKIKKQKTLRDSTNNKIIKNTKTSINEITNNNSRKVKFNNNIEFIEVECWKSYNLEQTADENFDALFMDCDKEDKDKLNKDDKNKKRPKDKGDVSCVCIIL